MQILAISGSLRAASTNTTLDTALKDCPRSSRRIGIDLIHFEQFSILAHDIQVLAAAQENSPSQRPEKTVRNRSSAEFMRILREVFDRGP